MLNPCNKKEFRTYTLRALSLDVDSPSKMKAEIIQQCDLSVSENDDLELGYFYRTKKVWLNNRLDLNDMWQLLTKGNKVTLWCVENNETNSNKRPRDKDEEDQPPPKKSSRIDTQKAHAKEYETELKTKHESKYTPFQLKLWAEMYANGSHNSLDEPPAAAMFNRENKQSRSSHGQHEVMVSVIERLCTALTPQQEKGKGSISTSPLKRVELRSAYIKQLNEIMKMVF